MYKKIILIAVGVIVLGAGGYFFGSYHKNTPSTIAVGGVGPASGFDNINMTGSLKVGAAAGDTSASGYGDGTIFSTGVQVSSSTMYAAQGLNVGGLNSTTTPASMTMRASDFSVSTLLSINPTVGAITLTLPASTTMNTAGFLPYAGDCTEDVFHNSTTTAAAAITMAAGTGSLLLNASSTATAGKILPGGAARFIVCRKVNTDYMFLMIPFI